MDSHYSFLQFFLNICRIWSQEDVQIIQDDIDWLSVSGKAGLMEFNITKCVVLWIEEKAEPNQC